jgi:phospholipase C
VKHLRRLVIVPGAAAMVAGAATVPGGTAPAIGGTPPAATASPINHVVVIYLENHSFDSVLGFWCDQNPGRCPDGGMPSTVKLSDGTVVSPSDDPDTVPAVNHNVASQLAAMNIKGGVPQMNGWQSIPNGSCSASASYRCISGYRPKQIPNLATLAGDFAISNRFFSLADSPSWGGHLYSVSGTLDGFTGDNPRNVRGVNPGTGEGCDKKIVAKWVNSQGTQHFEPACIPDPSLSLPNGGAWEPTPVPYVPTLLTRLDAAGLGWRIYSATPGQRGTFFSVCPFFAECLDGPDFSQVVASSQFQADAASGSLPVFSLVTPGGSTFLDSCHNSQSMTACDNWVGSLVNAVEAGPDWSSTAIFITFDDCGCFYDQVAPPKAPDGTQEGPRVPLIIVSPYAKPGYSDTTPASFASILAYTENNFGLAPLGVNDAQAYDLSGAFDYSQAPLRPAHMVTRKLPWSARHLHITRAMLDDPT